MHSRHGASVLLFSTILLLPACVVPRGPRPRDVWHNYVLDDAPYGYAHTRVERLADGNYRYHLETRTLVDFLGSREEITSVTDFVVTPRFRPVSLEAAQQSATGTRRVTGTVRDGALHATVTRGSASQTKVIPQADTLLPDICLADWLARQPADTQRVQARLLRTDALRAQTLTAQRKDTATLPAPAGGTIWELTYGDDSGTGIAVYDETGTLLAMKVAVPPVTLLRAPAEEARDIGYAQLSGRYVLSFPLDADITAPDRLESLDVRLRWRDIPRGRFNLEDRRQHVVEQRVRDGVFEAIVRITPPAPLEAIATLPIDDATLAPYLRETPYIKPLDERIQTIAREVVAGETDALLAARRLAEWVNDYVQDGLPTETLTGPEVLECGRGKCTEYATLYASLARAAGLPTRIALGDRLVTSNWIGHMWNEVYVGDWVTVDASVGSVDADMTLLKFVHSDTVGGTQPLRWALIDSLELAVVDFKQRRAALADAYETGVAGHTYTNVDLGFRIVAPDDAWLLEDKSTPGAVTIQFHLPDDDDALVHLVAFPLPKPVAAAEIIDARLGLFGSRYTDFEVLTRDAYTVAGVEGEMLTFARAGAAGELGPMRTTEIVWTVPRAGFLANLIAPTDVHDALRPTLDALVANFQFLGES
jgi:hypothetical protein